jgi:uncharacterized membrane protein YdcZ (DUF606 family)
MATPTTTTASSAAPTSDSGLHSSSALSSRGALLRLLASTATALVGAYVSLTIASSILAHVPALIAARAPWWTIAGAFAAAAIAMAPASAWPAIGGAMTAAASGLVQRLGGGSGR